MDIAGNNPPRLNWRGALLALVIGSTGAGAAEAAGKRSELDVAALLKRLPVEVFDHTTEGIEEDELRVLRTRGQSENWKIARKSRQKVVFAAKRPFSEVNLRPAQDGPSLFIEALTFNEKAVSYSYWIARSADAPLEAHEPGAVFRLFNEREDGRPGIDAQQAPRAIVDHARLRERCAFARRQAAPAASGCEDLRGKAAAIRQQFSKEPRWTAIIDRIGKVVGE